MTLEELRNSEDYKKAVDKIKGYSKGFEFTVYYNQMNTPLKNAMYKILKDCTDQGLIESIQMGVNLDMEITDETFRRL